jgi:hypothetical protein
MKLHNYFAVSKLFWKRSIYEMSCSLWKMPLKGGEASKVLDGLSNYLSLAIVDNGVVFVPTQDRASLQFLSFATNKIMTLAHFDKPIALRGSGGVAVSPDGRWILGTQFDQAGSELELVENFR